MKELYTIFLEEGPKIKIDFILVDGNGILHCNECGCASHLGVELDVPTIGCGKTIFSVDGLYKTLIREIKDGFRDNNSQKGDYVPLVGNSGKVWGNGLKSGKDSNDPLIVSIGHRVSLETATKIVDTCCKHRVPEPIRFVDHASRQRIKALVKKLKQGS